MVQAMFWPGLRGPVVNRRVFRFLTAPQKKEWYGSFNAVHRTNTAVTKRNNG